MNQTTTQASKANSPASTEKTSHGSLIHIKCPAKLNFYDFYLNEHQNMACRRLHFAGSSFGLLALAKSVKNRSAKPLQKGMAA